MNKYPIIFHPTFFLFMNLFHNLLVNRFLNVSFYKKKSKILQSYFIILLFYFLCYSYKEQCTPPICSSSNWLNHNKTKQNLNLTRYLDLQIPMWIFGAKIQISNVKCNIWIVYFKYLNFCTKNWQNYKSNLDFWRENSKIFNLKINVARFARNILYDTF